MRIILTDKPLLNESFPKDVEIKRVTFNTLKNYDGNADVVAVAGSRAMAIAADKMSLPSLKLFQLTSAGFDGVPLSSFAEKGISVANAGAVYSAPIAETVVFGMLQFAKRFRKNPNNRRFKITRGYSFITELKDKKVLIMGAGNIGTAIADRLKGFDLCIDGYDPFCPEKEQYGKIIRNAVELKENIGDYDYIVSTLPDNDDTKGFVDFSLFSLMKKSAVIVNVGRKAVFNENDFYNALKKGVIGGAILDMFEKLPNPVTNKFRRLKNVIVLPGVSAISKELNVRLSEHMTANVLALLNGEKVNNVINGV